jgi:hypothetical protein
LVKFKWPNINSPSKSAWFRFNLAGFRPPKWRRGWLGTAAADPAIW